METNNQKGSCKYCYKETRSLATKMCNHCASLHFMMQSNVEATIRILDDIKNMHRV